MADLDRGEATPVHTSWLYWLYAVNTVKKNWRKQIVY